MEELIEHREVLSRMTASVPEHVQVRIDLTIGIADRIVKLMRERGVSKRQLADAMGVRLSTIGKWISGQYNFDIDTIARLSAYFGQPVISVIF